MLRRQQLWKEGIVKAGDRGTLVARGFVGPARWIKTPVSLQHQENTLKYTPELYLDRPGEITEGAMKLIENEIKGLNAVSTGDESKAIFAGGECAQRIHDLPAVQDLVDNIVKDAAEIISSLANKHLIV